MLVLERVCGLWFVAVERYFAFRYRLEPGLEKECLLWSYVGTCRFVHNAALLYLSESYCLWKARGADPDRRPARSWQGLGPVDKLLGRYSRRWGVLRGVCLIV